MMSAELVPLTYARNAYNALHDTALQGAGDLLTAEQAGRINDYYDIELHLGTHAHGMPKALSGNLFAESLQPASLEYDQAATVVEEMQPGDTLFIENYGFSQQPRPLSPITDEALSSNHLTRQELEQKRHEGHLSAWQYAKGLAELKGITALYADQDAFDKVSLRALTGGKNIPELMKSSNEEERSLVKDMHRQRELRARNIVKDWALAHLPPGDTPGHEDRKPKLVILFGRYHKEGLEEAFNNLGLDTKTFILRSMSIEARTKRLASRLITEVVGAPDFGPSVPEYTEDKDQSIILPSLKKRPYKYKKLRPEDPSLHGSLFYKDKPVMPLFKGTNSYFARHQPTTMYDQKEIEQ